MALQNWTSGTAKVYVQNNRAAHPGWSGLEHWRNLIAQFDPHNVRVAQEERAAIMRGACSKTWTEFEQKMIGWEGRLLKYEQRVQESDNIKDPDKCRILFDMLPLEAQNKYDDLLEHDSYKLMRKRLVSLTTRGKLEERRRGVRINMVGD